MLKQERVAAVAAGLLAAARMPSDNRTPLQIVALALNVEWVDVEARLQEARGEWVTLPARVVAEREGG